MASKREDGNSVTAPSASSVLGLFGVAPAPPMGVTSGPPPAYLFPEQEQPYTSRMVFWTGAAYGTGLLVGGTVGGLQAFRTPANTWKLRVNSIFNGAGKIGARTANMVGVCAFMYTSVDALLGTIRDKRDVVNEVGAAAITGMLYKSSRGVRAAALGGLAGCISLGVANALRTAISPGRASSMGFLSRFQSS